MDNQSEKRIKTLKKQSLTSLIIAAALILAGSFGFFSGWHQIKRPVLLIIGFDSPVDQPRKSDEITPAQISDFVKAFKKNDYNAISPEIFLNHINQQLSGRFFLISFSSFTPQTKAIADTLFKNEGICPVVFFDNSSLENADEISKLLSSKSLFPGFHYEAWQKNRETIEKIVLDKPVMILKQKNEQLTDFSTGNVKTVFFVNEPREVINGSDTQFIPIMKYVKGASEAGMPDIKDWLPPNSARRGSLTITLSLLLYFISFSWLIKSWAMIQSASRLKKAEEKQGSL